MEHLSSRDAPRPPRPWAVSRRRRGGGLALFSGRLTTPQPPSGESEDTRGATPRAEGEASPVPAPQQGNDIPTANDTPELSGRPANPPPLNGESVEEGGGLALFSRRPTTPQPPSGESEEEGGDAEGDVPPAPAPQPMKYLRSVGGPLASLAGQVLRDCTPIGNVRRIGNARPSFADKRAVRWMDSILEASSPPSAAPCVGANVGLSQYPANPIHTQAPSRAGATPP